MFTSTPQSWHHLLLFSILHVFIKCSETKSSRITDWIITHRFTVNIHYCVSVCANVCVLSVDLHTGHMLCPSNKMTMKTLKAHNLKRMPQVPLWRVLIHFC